MILCLLCPKFEKCTVGADIKRDENEASESIGMQVELSSGNPGTRKTNIRKGI